MKDLDQCKRESRLRSCFIAWFLFLSFLAVVDSASGQPSCCDPPFNFGLARFARDAVITVTISSSFTAEERADILTAYSEWNAARFQNGTNIVFSGFHTGETPILSNNNQFVGYDPSLPAASGINNMSSGSAGVWSRITLFGRIRLPPDPEIRRMFTRGVIRHEIGHSFGLDNAHSTCPDGTTVMGWPPAVGERVITDCDNSVICSVYCPKPEPTPTPTPEPTPSPTPIPWCTDPTFCGLDFEYCLCAEFGGYWDPFFCNCWYYSPILIDVNGDGFRLSDAPNGVAFDLTADGVPEQLGWTRPGTDDGWLVLDRNHNGVIDDGTELFGNYSPQPQPPPGVAKNGFLALAEYDKPENGGNSDGVISRRDQIFRDLRIWQDDNHNGFSEPHELRELEDIGLRKISLDYSESNRVDQHGNRFKFRARVLGAQDAQLGRWAWDVYLVSQGLSGVNLLMRNIEIYSLAKPKCRPRVDKML